MGNSYVIVIVESYYDGGLRFSEKLLSDIYKLKILLCYVVGGYTK